MKRQNKNIMTGLLLIAGLFIPLGLQAQTFLGTPWTQTSPAVTTGTDTNGTFLSTAPLNLSLTFNTTETGTTNPQFLWVPGLSALRAGAFASAPSATTMGEYSVAFGYNTTASGAYSAAFGGGTAIGPSSTAFGSGYASGSNSLAFGSAADATGSYSVAGGLFVSASGAESVALGYYSNASNTNATALGGGYASGPYSTAMSSGSASGTYAAAIGYGATATAYNSLVIGTYNLNKGIGATTPTTSSWVSTDPLFEIGNGTNLTPADAMVVYKNGSGTIQGPLTGQAGFLTTPASVATTDIPMYQGGN